MNRNHATRTDVKAVKIPRMPGAQINALHAAATGGLFRTKDGAYFASYGTVTAASYKLLDAGLITAGGPRAWQNDRRNGHLIEGQHIEATEAGRAKLTDLGISIPAQGGDSDEGTASSDAV